MRDVTLSNYMLEPGLVVRSVVEENRITYVQSHGEGVGNWSTFNELIGPAAMAKLDQDIRIYLHRRTYLAPNRIPAY